MMGSTIKSKNTRLKRTTVHVLQEHKEWLERQANEQSQAKAQILRRCIEAELQSRSKPEVNSENTSQMCVYIGTIQFTKIQARCKTQGGTISAFVRSAITRQMRALDKSR
jgi:hypothetical protein